MFTVVLAEPEHPGNIGSVCRVMSNFGLTDLVLINPQCQVNQETRNLAKNAQKIVEGIRTANWDVLSEFNVVVATAGKNTTDQNLLRSPLTPQEAADKLRSAGGSVALLFGRESDGLRNAELARADFVVTIPTTQQHPSMNLSHSVAVVLAQLYAAEVFAPRKRFIPMPPAEKAVLYAKVDKLLDGIDFPTEGKRATQKKIWRSIFGRAILTRAESHATLGFFRALERLDRQKRTSGTRSTKRKQ